MDRDQIFDYYRTAIAVTREISRDEPSEENVAVLLPDWETICGTLSACAVLVECAYHAHPDVMPFAVWLDRITGATLSD